MTPSAGLVRGRRARAAALPVAAVVLLLAAIGTLLGGAWGGSSTGGSVRPAGTGGPAFAATATGWTQIVRPITRNGGSGTSVTTRRSAALTGTLDQRSAIAQQHAAGQPGLELAVQSAAPVAADRAGTVFGGTDPAMLPCRPRAPGQALLAVPRLVSAPIPLTGGPWLACSTRAPPNGVLVVAP